ncbi:MAG: long-chain-fatty-acid--CoA ligase [Thermosulfidibacteraceae bacterium]|jgi:long-chain acyl-CoA synthetase
MEGKVMESVYLKRPWLKHYPPEVPHTLEYPDKPLFWLLDEAHKKYADKTAMVFYDKKWSYRDLHAMHLRLAAFLQNVLNIKPQDRVALLLPNCPLYPISYFAILRINGIVVQLNPLYSEYELEKLIEDSGSRVIITLDVLTHKLGRAVEAGLVDVMIVANMRDFLPFPLNILFALKTLRLPKLKSRKTRIVNFKDIPDGVPRGVNILPDEDVAVFQYTGGTTGFSKAAMLTHKNILSNVIQLTSWAYQVDVGNEVTLAVLPFFHVYGMTVGMLFTIYVGGTLILEPRFDAERVVKLIEKYRVTMLPGVPTMYVAINRVASKKKVNLMSMKFCLSGGAPLPVEVANEFERLTGAKLREGYGLSETSPVTHANLAYGESRKGSIGIPVPDTLAKVVDVDTGEEVPIGVPGELCIKGPQVMKGYWNRPEENEIAFDKGGWFKTGDIAIMDEDGYFYIVDRKKDMIIAGGYNIYPREVEEVLYGHPKVLEAAVVGVKDEYRGETVKAYIVLKPGEKAASEEIIEFCKSRLASYKVPKIVEFVSELPKSPIGKVLRRELKKQ